MMAQPRSSTQPVAQAQPRPTLWTDQVDYQPGSTAVISGAGFLSGETVTMLVLHADGTSDSDTSHQEWTTVANASGRIQTQWQVSGAHHEGVILRATATGRTSGLIASVRFSDPVENIVYLRSTHSSPWGYGGNAIAMNRVFGTDQWLDLRYETVNVASMLASAKFIYMEGSDQNADAMEAFLAANSAAIATWVSNGNSLVLNAAPLQGDGMSLGFGMTLSYIDVNVDTTHFTETGVAASTALASPIFAGPFLPVGASWPGTYFGHATVSGTGLVPLIRKTNPAIGRIVLGETSHGSGRVLFGGMTAVEFHDLQPESSNLRANILSYALQGTAANIAPSFSVVPTQNVLLGATSPVPSVSAIKFEWLATAGNDPIDFYVNGVQAGTTLNANVGGGDVDRPEVGAFTTTAPATLAAFAVNGTNDIRVVKGGLSGTKFAWARMTVYWSDGTQITTPVVEVTDGDATELDINVAGWVDTDFDTTATFLPAELATDPCPAITISGVTGGEVWQPVTVTAVSGNTGVVDNVTVTTSGDTRILKFHPVAYGTTTVTVTADDGYPTNNSFSQVFTINVIPLADAGPDFGRLTGTSVALSGSLLTPNVGTITYNWVQTAGTPVVLSGANTLTPSFTAPASPTILKFALTITGNGQPSVPDEVEVAISAPSMNNPPVANAGPDQLVTGGSVVTLNGSGSSDINNDPITYAWTQISGPAVTLTGSNTAYPTFATSRANATLVFELKVSDGGGFTTDQVQVQVSSGVVPLIARPAIVNVQSALGTIRGGVSDKADRKTLDKAVESLADAVNAANWIDNNHLVCAKGKKVFDNIKEAAKTLEKLIKSNKTPGLAAQLQPQLNNLVGAANLLASIAYNDLLAANPASPALAAAQTEFAKADAAAADGKASKAIGNYKKAWCKVCGVASDPGDDGDDHGN